MNGHSPWFFLHLLVVAATFGGCHCSDSGGCLSFGSDDDDDEWRGPFVDLGPPRDMSTDYCGPCIRVDDVPEGWTPGEACFDGCNYLDCRTGTRTDFACDDAGPPDPEPGVCPAGWGGACTAEVGCRLAGAVCVADDRFAGTFDIGGPTDPIVDYPGGEDSVVERSLFPGGFCTSSFPLGETPATCDPTDPNDTFCGECSKCVDLFGTAPEGVCMGACTPNPTDNSGCRDGYECRLDDEVCAPGCSSDDQCRIAREESNGVPGTQFPTTCSTSPADCTPADCGDPAPANPAGCADPGTNFDRLVYDTSSAAVCNPDTFRCEG